MEDEEDINLELYGTSPGVMAFFMILISLIVPIGIIPLNAFMLLGDGLGYGYPNFLIYSITWCYAPEFPVALALFPLFILLNVWLTLPLTILNIVYIWKIIRYYKGNCTRYSAIWVGMLSITLPTVFALSLGMFSLGGGLLFIGPIPIQFVVGLIFLYKIPGPELTSPWRGNLADNSWWRPKRPEWWYRMFPLDGEENAEAKESESSTESNLAETN